jgi:hypothetical protein
MWLLNLPIKMVSPFDKRVRKKGRTDQTLLEGRLKIIINLHESVSYITFGQKTLPST